MRKPKNLRLFCVRVVGGYQRKIATQFYMRATHKPKTSTFTSDGEFVGMVNDYDVSGHLIKQPSKVHCGWYASHCETIIPFRRINELADTPARKKALKHVMSQ